MRRHSLAVAALLLVLAPLAGCKRNEYHPPPPPKVAVAQPVRQSFTRYLETTGTLAAVNDVDLVARIEGFLQEQNYKDGDIVAKGTILFTIEPLPWQAKLQQAQAAEAGTQAQLAQTDTEYKRQAQLGRSDFAAQSAVDQALANRDQARANLQQAQANTQLAAINYTYTRVIAPFDGMVTAHLVSVGEVIGRNTLTRLASIVQIDPIYVNFNLSEPDVQRIRAARRAQGGGEIDFAKVPVEIGLQSESGYPHQGNLDYAAPTVDASTGTLTVRGVLKNQDRALLPGYFVRVRVPLGPPQDGLMVPDTALGTDQGGRYLLVAGAGDVVERRSVTLGPLVGALRVIEAGIGAPDRVVIGGLDRAVPGETVAPEPRPLAAAAAR